MSKTILIVEDEEDNLMVITHILQFVMGQDAPLVARNGHEAIRVAYAQNPDIILMDLSLPKMSGWEAARSLRSDEKFRDTPILALTAHAMSGDRDRALEAGCDDYFTKPIDIDAFVIFMKPHLQSKSVETPNNETTLGE